MNTTDRLERVFWVVVILLVALFSLAGLTSHYPDATMPLSADSPAHLRVDRSSPAPSPVFVSAS